MCFKTTALELVELSISNDYTVDISVVVVVVWGGVSYS